MNVYRAATQSVVIDEAFTYTAFLAGPLSDLLAKYDANHHILNSFLCKLSISLMGVSELTLRLPSLLGGLLYLITSLRLCRRLFGEGWLLLFTFALLTMSPALLDYFSAARGYGMALAFLLLAIWQMLNYDEGSRRLEWAGLCLALSVAANLSFAFAAVPLAVFFSLALAFEKRANEAIDRFLVPGLVIAFSIVILPLTHAVRANFYAGLPSLGASLESVWGIFLFKDLTGLTEPRIFAAVVPRGRWVMLLVLVAAIAACARGKAFRDRSPADRVLLLATIAMAGSIALLVAGHRFFGLLYPIRRTGIYWIPLFTLICLTLAAKVSRSQWGVAAVAPCLAAGAACLLQFVGQLNVHHYTEWPYDFDTRRAVRRIIADYKLNPRKEVTVVVSWTLEHSVDFYRRRYRLHWMKPVQRTDLVTAGDYFLLQGLHGQDRVLVEKLGLTKLYENEAAKLVLAVPTPSPR